jgi:hypothetical protein
MHCGIVRVLADKDILIDILIYESVVVEISSKLVRLTLLFSEKDFLNLEKQIKKFQRKKVNACMGRM